MSEIEKRLLGRLLEPEAIAEAWDCGVRPEQFEQPLYQAIFNWTTDYWQQSKRQAAPTAWVLAQEFAGYVPAPDITEQVFELAALLRRRYATNQLQEMLRKAAGDGQVDPEGALKELFAAAYSASEIVTPRRTRVNMAETAEERKARYLHGEEYPQGLGVPYGIDLLDVYTGGVYPGELAVVGGFAKTGKTWFLCNAAVTAKRQGFKPMLYSLEVGLDEIQERIDALWGGVSYNQITRKTLPVDQKDRLWESIDELTEKGGIDIERPDPGERTVSQLINRARQAGCDYVLIDQLSRLEAGHKTYSTKELRASVMSQLSTEISRSGAKIACLMAVQMRRGEDEPSLESFADAAEVEREVDMALGLWRNQELRNQAQMQCEILGSRRSDSTKFLLNWQMTNRTLISGREELRR